MDLPADLSPVAILLYAFGAFVLGLALTPSFMAFLRKNRLGKQLRVETVDGREASIFRKYHEKKFGTPTMGGLLIWGSIVLTVLFSRTLSLSGVVTSSLLDRGQVYLPLFVLLSFGILGAIDDYLNVVGSNEEEWKKRLPPIRVFFVIVTILGIAGAIAAWMSGGVYHLFDSLGIAGTGRLVALGILFVLALAYIGAAVAVLDSIAKRRMTGPNKKGGLAAMPKLVAFVAVSLAVALWFYTKLDYNSIFIPFLGDIQLGWWYIPLAVFIIVGTANAVNVTDGLDGLAGGLLVIAFSAFGVIAFFSGLTVLAAFCAVTAGAIGAFLWHNVPPALFYMGDTGSLALGSVLAVIALMTDQVLLLALVGFVFMIEMLSVIIQLTSKRLRGGKKIFKAAPIHHHFEALEWGESKVTMRMWIIGAFCAFLAIVIGLYSQRPAEEPIPAPVSLLEAAVWVSHHSAL
jgi:phospho-N-acetylmuramoyl-pentapeptide-transferase